MSSKFAREISNHLKERRSASWLLREGGWERFWFLASASQLASYLASWVFMSYSIWSGLICMDDDGQWGGRGGERRKREEAGMAGEGDGARERVLRGVWGALRPPEEWEEHILPSLLPQPLPPLPPFPPFPSPPSGRIYTFTSCYYFVIYIHIIYVHNLLRSPHVLHYVCWFGLFSILHVSSFSTRSHNKAYPPSAVAFGGKWKLNPSYPLFS